MRLVHMAVQPVPFRTVGSPAQLKGLPWKPSPVDRRRRRRSQVRSRARVPGVLSHLGRKNAEEIATFVQVERQVLQDCIGTAPWDHRPLVTV